jgi:hypothetical protein
MTLGAMVDVVVGLMLCYLLLGLIGSALLEALAGWLNLRGRQLERGLRDLLASGEGSAQHAALFEPVYRHGLIVPEPGGRAPAYIAPANFSAALLDVLGRGQSALTLDAVRAGIEQLPPGGARQALAALLAQSQGELPVLRAGIERWFNHGMGHVSGAYKRFTNNVMLAFGLAVALGGRIDSLALARTLWADAHTAAASTGTGAAATVAAGAAASPAAWPIGWSADVAWSWPLLIGCLVTALATSVGAPFWFDTLQKFLQVRAAGPRPPTA